MYFYFKLNTDLIKRKAIQLFEELNYINTNIFISKINNRTINGKSLLGILSGNFHKNDTITVFINNLSEKTKIEQIFSKYGSKTVRG